MFKIVVLLFGTFFALLYIILSIKGGNKYKKYINALKEDDFALHDGYGVGFMLMELSFLHIPKDLEISLKRESAMLYPPRFSEFYTRARWAQLLTLSELSLAFFFVLAAILYDYALFMVAVGIILAGFCAYYSLTYMRDKYKKRSEKCSEELPDIVSTLALLINSGMVLRGAWEIVAMSRDGELFSLMKQSVAEMKNGMPDLEAFGMVGEKAGSQDVKKFVSLLIQNMNKGGSDLSNFLKNQASDMLQLHRNIMLQKGEVAASKLVAPIGLIFLGVIIIVAAAVISSFSFGI